LQLIVRWRRINFPIVLSKILKNEMTKSVKIQMLTREIWLRSKA
jgi:hypothetical protein